MQSSVRKTLPARPSPPTGDRSSSTAPVSESGTKKRRREVGSEDRSFDSVIAKKIRPGKASARGSSPCDSPPHIRAQPEGLRTRGEDGAEFPPLLGTVDDDPAPAIGTDDYTGALYGSGECDREESLSEGKGVSTSGRLSRPSSPAGKVEMKPCVALRKYALLIYVANNSITNNPSRSLNPNSVDATAAPERPSPSHQHQDRHSGAVVAEVSGFLSKSVAPLQPSQEPTPPHTSAISSPRSPPPHQLSPTSGALTQNGVDPRHVSSASQKRRHNASAPRKRIIAPGEGDDIFSTPPPQMVKEHPPSRARRRGPPRLVEGPFRSAYTNANGEPRLMLHGRRASGMDEERVTDGENEDWPPRRERRNPLIFSEGPPKRNTIALQEYKQPTVEVQQQSLSSTLYALDPVPADESGPMALVTNVAVLNENVRGSTLPSGQTKTTPLQVAQVVSPAIDQTSMGAHRPLQPKVTPSLSQDRALPNSERHFSSHSFVQAKRQALATDRNRLLFPVVSAHDLPPPVPGSPSKRASLDQYPNPAAHSGPLVDDPFIVPPIKHKARRQTLAGERQILQADSIREKLIRRASVQHIDLRTLRPSKSAGTSVTGSATSLGRTSDVKKKRRPPRSSTPPNLTESNKELVLALGLEEVYLRMAENHRFHIELVREVAARQRSLQDADRVLRNMREAAGREFARLLRQGEATYSAVESEAEESEVQDEEDAETPGDEEDNNQPVRQVQARPGSNISPTSLIPQRRERPTALKITTESPESSPMRPPDYTPPTPTRAHEFCRLERQGRVGEARLREARRVRCSYRPNSTDVSPEVDEQRIVTYLLQLQDDKDGDLMEKHRDEYIKDEMQDEGGIASISPGSEGHGDADSTQLQGNGFAEEQVDAGEVTAANERQASPEDLYNGSLDREHGAQAPSSPARSALTPLSSLAAEWTNSDDELLLDGDLIVHEELVRRKGLSCVKFRTAHLYGLLLGD